MVKHACAEANHTLGKLSDQKLNAIKYSCDQLIRGAYHEQFPIDLIQGGAGTSTNMNANEVIANIGLEHLGYKKVNINTCTQITMSICRNRPTMFIQLQFA